MYRKITVVPYNPQWPEQFDSLAKSIRQALGENCLKIHHIGSTAVPKLAAKPVIDMIPVVKDICAVDACNQSMQALGFECKGEMGMLFRRYFYKNENDERRVNVHVYEQGNPEIQRHLLFRDFLRTHPNEREAYGNLKQNLAKKFPESIENYLDGKDAFVEQIDKQTGFTGLRLVEVLMPKEWQAYHRIRKELIYDLLNIEYNPKHFTITAANHKHIILYQNTQIVGVMHLEFIKDNTVAIRPFAIDTPYQKKGLGSAFYGLIEKWLQQQGVELVQLHANTQALSFYKRLGFVEMDFHEDGKEEAPVPMIDLGKKLKPEKSS